MKTEQGPLPHAHRTTGISIGDKDEDNDGDDRDSELEGRNFLALSGRSLYQRSLSLHVKHPSPKFATLFSNPSGEIDDPGGGVLGIKYSALQAMRVGS